MFQRILIANRGEIACRVIDTARRLGVETVAVYSDADAEARHVAMADRAVRIGPPPAAESYLNGAAIIEAARATGAQAIHPGYGFLSENPDFAEAVAAAGLVFVGPSAKAIRAMGLKDAAKALMERAGVPVVPGYHGEDQSPERLSREARRIGYPILIKAVAGGGGKGMRRVDDPSRFAEALEGAKREAKGAFGNDAVLIEKYVSTPRHIEVQVFGDGIHAVHLFERDCSLQRRHQKVIEEAPAPGMTPAMRTAICEAAVRAAMAVGYSGAGTVEFIADASDGLHPSRFWFMEMNTRLQVEHPVTEAVTGVDLVEWQLRVASGEPLPRRQEDLRLHCHAVEARLYAEDVPAGFLPATGRLAHLRFPGGVRVETGVREGDEITPWYDPMIAKLVALAPTRAEALVKLGRALDETRVAGCVTNLGFLSALVRHERVRAGEVDTGLIARDLDRLVPSGPPPPEAVAVAALAAAGPADGPLAGFHLWTPLSRRVDLRWKDEPQAVTLALAGPRGARITMDGRTREAARGEDGWRIGSGAAFDAVAEPTRVTVFGGREGTWVFDHSDPLDRDVDATGHDVTASPMPGLVRAVLVAAGQAVAKGDRLVVVEAMKMEHALSAPRDGRVAEVLVAEGEQVEAGAPLVRLEAEDG
ncbi:Methylcrotonyl-CoA carboxylase biotin-containing subunit [Rubellimicrobium mesophilum DSM 19309]|uniref:Methylcrotonyl-CoA carboxylase biotin-containing subunit n=1 Tax=Rubellimicrobium mesophilum DSM 19309 TaxID=442562 RepID=A0A017HM61_9RHOB|nr:acetyl/propionyl/methylcrotonyl-CoA carboxylase subunit alpha [Rubellimicrobium mesophilum]EYD74874.1 Methylcrotonyl-CoA carboxylase biotin-containing subunit [Rubellimicrobium mesophilum DSM 19309]